MSDDDLFHPPATAQQLAEKGIRESHEHAEQVLPDWSARAVEKVGAFAKQQEYFLAEDVKAWAYEDGLEPPPVDGAWGQVMLTAAERGIIHRFGRKAATSPGSHGKLMTLWRRGPANIAEPPVTAKIIADDIRVLGEVVLEYRRDGRSIIAHRLEEIAAHLRQLGREL